MDIRKTIEKADEAMKIGKLKTAWILLKPHAANVDARKRLRWIQKRVQELGKQGSQTNDKKNGTDPQSDIQIASEKTDSLEVHSTNHKQHITYISSSVATSSALFDLRVRGSDIKICLNASHPLYPLLTSARYPVDSSDIETLTAQLSNAQIVIDLLLQGWSIFENSEPIGPRLDRIQAAREDWGRAIRDMLQDTMDND